MFFDPSIDRSPDMSYTYTCTQNSFADERRARQKEAQHTKKKKRARGPDSVEEEEEEAEGGSSPLDRLTFGVAYNPYLPEEGGLWAEEKRRLKVRGCGVGLF